MIRGLRAAAASMLLAFGVASVATESSAQYYGGSDRGYDRSYERGYREGRRDERRWDDRRGYDGRRGWDDRRGGDRRYGAGPRNDGMPRGWDRMSDDQQKQAIKNQREAQKKLIKRGYIPQ